MIKSYACDHCGKELSTKDIVRVEFTRECHLCKKCYEEYFDLVCEYKNRMANMEYEFNVLRSNFLFNERQKKKLEENAEK